MFKKTFQFIMAEMSEFKRSFRKNTFWKDIRDAYYYYLSPADRTRLAAMGWFRRWFAKVFWLFKSIFRKLSPFRGGLLIASLFFISTQNTNSQGQLGYILIFIILILELKDKLIARDELHAGRAVQSALLPENRVKITGWDVWFISRPANEVSGDLVDFVSIDDSRTGLVVADVAGKGLGAALLMSKLQASIRALLPYFSKPAQLVSDLNHIFCRDGVPSRFISCVYLEITAGEERVKLCNAGHMPPLHVKGDSVRELSKGGNALGLNPTSKFREMQIQVEPGESLIVYSDGLSEARNEKGEFYGEGRIFRILSDIPTMSSAEIGQSLIDDVETFVDGAVANDDLTLLVLTKRNVKKDEK